MVKPKYTYVYAISDYVTAGVAWWLFYTYRKIFIESQKYGFDVPLEYGTRFFSGLFFLPLFWLLFYFIRGYYDDVLFKSRLKEMGETMLTSIFGVIVLFFVLILDDTIVSYKSYYEAFFVLLGFHFTITYIPRLVVTTRIIHQIRRRRIWFNTLIVGSNERALHFFTEVESQPVSSGNKFVGYVTINGDENLLKDKLPHLGSYNDLADIIKQYKVEEIVLAIETTDHNRLAKLLNKLYQTQVSIKLIPTLFDMLITNVKSYNLYGPPLLEISPDAMPAFDQHLKRLTDVVLASIAMFVLLPVYGVLALVVKWSSEGDIFYAQERIGRYGKPFLIYKFRSMYNNAEANGPALSSAHDSRVTSVGRTMRKLRLDELPQFYNVLRGDMSLVGPRPERQFFIDQIVQRAPHYYRLFKVRPGITSWGQVKYGYAENVDQMIERLNYDIIYLENMSLYLDLKILIYTIKTILERSGK